MAVRRQRTMSWIYQARRKATNANAAGHPMIIDIAINAGQIAKLVSAYVISTTTGTHSMKTDLLDEDNAAHTQIGYCVTAAQVYYSLPSIGQAAAASAAIASSVGLIIPAGAKLSFYTLGDSGAAGDTLEIGIVLELFNLPTEPTWDKSRSTDTANITLAASTISAANTITRGRIWT